MKSFISLIIVLAIISLGFFFFNNTQTEDTKGIENQAGWHTLTFNDLSHNAISLNEITEGKIAVINSWATWCPFCTKELQDFAALQADNPEIIVIAINRKESLDRNTDFINNANLTDTLTFLLDPKDEFYTSIGAFAMPETIFVNSDGTLNTHKRGPINLAEMQNIVNKMN